MAKKSFYEIGSSDGYLREGFYLEVRRQINYRGDRADFKPFLNVPVKDLEKQLKKSQAEEKKVFDEMKKACQKAIDQIKDRRYQEYLLNDDRKRIRIYGIAFCKKRCCVISEDFSMVN